MSTVSMGELEGVYERPRGKGPFPGLVVLHEMFGVNDDMRRIVGRFAESGYATVGPDLYSGGFRPLCIARLTLDVLANEAQGTTARIADVSRWLAERPEVDADRIGVVGFCLGGGFALVAAARHPFRAAAVNYAPVPGDAAELEGICPVIASYGGRDQIYGDHGERLRSHLEELDVPHDVKTYPSSGHSFMNRTFRAWWSPVMVGMPLGSPVKVPVPVWSVTQPLMQVGYCEDDAEDSWARILDFLDRWMGEGAGAPAR